MSPEIVYQLIFATGQTFYMVTVSALLGTLFGLPIGAFLATSKAGEIFAAPAVNAVIGAVVIGAIVETPPPAQLHPSAAGNPPP